MTRHIRLLLACFWCVGLVACETAYDNHLDLLQRSAAKQADNEDIDDNDEDDLDDLAEDVDDLDELQNEESSVDDNVEDLAADGDDLSDVQDEESSGVSVCASGENQWCQCFGTVYYGRKFVNGRPGGGAPTSLSQLRSSGFKSRSVSGSVMCSNGGMGGDPLYGYYKYCMCEASSSGDTSSRPFVCAHGENGNCQCDGTVYYGAKFVGGRPGGGQTTSFDQLRSRGYRSRSVSGSVSCSNGVFGDPLWGFYKYCYCEPRQTPSPTPSPTPKPTPSPTPSPTGKCRSACSKQYNKFRKRGKEVLGRKKVCKKSKCAGCAFCR